MAAAPIGEQAVAMQRWSGGDHRLLLVNFGAALRFDVGAQDRLQGAASLPWRAQLSTMEERFAGPGCDDGSLALQAGVATELPPRCAVLWAVGD